MDKTRRLSEDKTERLDNSPDFGMSDAEIPMMPSLGRLEENRLIAGRYQAMEELPTLGGEADVFRCLDLETKQGVAVKVYRARLHPKTELLKVLVGFRHENIVRLMDFGLWNDRFFEVMEYAEGGTLADHMPYDEHFLKVTVIPQVLAGIEHLHKNNIIHRDIKPTNLFFLDDRRQHVLVGDYGISSLVMGEESLHQSTSVKRTVEFAAKELYSGIFGYEVDYYALGITLLYFLSGESPFQSMNMQQIMHTHISSEENIHPPEDCSREFKNLIRGLLHKNYKKRWGYEHVWRWLNGETVRVEQYESDRSATFSYKLTQDLVAYSPEELAVLMLEYPETARKHIRQPQFYDTFNLFDQALASRLHDIRARARTLNEAFIEIVYTLNPELAYCLLNGYKASCPAELARQIDSGSQAWEAGRKQLYDGSISAWLRATGHRQIASIWEKASIHFHP